MTNIQPTTPHTLSGEIQTDIQNLHTRLLSIEKKATTEITGVTGWIKSHGLAVGLAVVISMALVLTLLAKHL